MKFLNTVDVNTNKIEYKGSFTASAEVSVSSTDSAVLYMFPSSLYSSAKFIVSISTTSENSVREVLVTQDGASGFITEYGNISTGSETYDDVLQFYPDGLGNAILSVSPKTTTPRSIKVYSTILE